MAGCGCGGGARAAKDMAQKLASTFGGDMLTDQGMVVIEYLGKGSGKQSLRHPATRREIQVSARPAHRYAIVPPEELDGWLDTGLFRRQAPPAPFVPPPTAGAELDTTYTPLAQPGKTVLVVAADEPPADTDGPQVVETAPIRTAQNIVEEKNRKRRGVTA